MGIKYDCLGELRYMTLFCRAKQWKLPHPDPDLVQKLCTGLGVPEVIAEILLERGLKNVPDARWFLSGEELFLYDPLLLPDMDKGCARVKEAVEKREKICVYGDYDVDGITATSLMYGYLRSLGADVSYYIPKRLTEGYGMNAAAVKSLADRGIGLIITVDNGITANAEIAYASELGIDVVVTDHHECHELLPGCCAVIDPKRADNRYPFDALSGVGVAFKLVCALHKTLTGKDPDEAFLRDKIDLVTLGTVADVMPLFDENRKIVTKGLACLGKGSNTGVIALLDEAYTEKNKPVERKITASSIGFHIAPRLNAAGRIGNVDRAVELLTAKSYDEAYPIAGELCRLNRERQHIESEIYNDASARIDADPSYLDDRVFVVAGENWHQGVVGIVASKLTEKYGLPAILISLDGDVGKGSARSIKGFNINEAIHSCRELLTRHGGHELAAGLTLPAGNIAEFRKQINEYARNFITEEVRGGCIDADAETTPADITLEMCEAIASLEPFGAGNPVPTLYMRDVKVCDVISLGQNKHTKLLLSKDGVEMTGVYFNFCPDDFVLPKTRTVDILYSLEANEFRGERNPQLIIKDIRMCKLDASNCELQRLFYREMLEGHHAASAPSVELCRKIYRSIRDNEGYWKPERNLYFAAEDVSEQIGTHVAAPVLGAVLDVFAQLGLCRLHRTDEMVVRLSLCRVNGKVDIESSSVLSALRGNPGEEAEAKSAV